MPVERIERLDDPRVAEYHNVPDPELLREHGTFVAEGRHVVRTLLAASRFEVRSVLVSPTVMEALADILPLRPAMPVYVADPRLMSAIVGFNVHRGCLATGVRPRPQALAEVLGDAHSSSRLLIVEHVANADNIGGLFRNAAAFGAEAVLLSPRCCDPLYRKAIRVSVGASLRVPFATLHDWPDEIAAVRRAGYTVVALTPDRSARELAAMVSEARWPETIAVMVGNEGEGLSTGALEAADVCARLAMEPGMDSVNVATAAAVALYLCRHRS